jgi:serine/threonine-protein kinase
MNDLSPGPEGGFLTGFEPGSVIAGYRLEKKIGSGGMAMVFLARDERLPRQAAVKVLAPMLASDESFRLRFIRESQAAAAVDDPHIIPVYEAGEAGGVLYIAMRYVAGGDVQGLLKREGQLPAAQVAAIVSAVASALDSAHAAGLVHRDVKPANILLDTRPGRPDHVYLSDFGLSKGALAAANLTRSGMFMGTPDYTAPEQIQGHPVSGQADQYGLACTAFELLCGEPVFMREQGMAIIYAHMSEPPPRLQSRRPDLPAAADAVLARALAKAPQDRFGSCGEFAAALRASLSVAPAAATQLAGQAPSWPGAGTTTQLAGQSREHEAARHRDIETAPRPYIPDRSSVAPRLAAWPRRPVSRRYLLVAGAAAVPVLAAGAGAILWATRTPSRAPRWQTQAPAGQAAMLAADGDLVVITGGPGVHALDARTGKPKWSASSRGGSVTALAVTPSVVYLALDSQIVNPFLALSASTGSVRWTGPFTARHGLATSPGYVYVGTNDLFALGSQDGSGRWDILAQLNSNAVIQAGSLYVLASNRGSPTTLRAFPLTDPVQRWETPGPPGGVLAADGSVICAAGRSAGGEPGRLWTWRAHDGHRLWLSAGPQSYGPPAVAAGVAYAVSQDRKLTAFHAATGSVLWTHPADPRVTPVVSSAVVSSAVVYAGDPSGGLLALRASDGKLLWAAPQPFRAGPVVAGGSVYVSNGSMVYAYTA